MYRRIRQATTQDSILDYIVFRILMKLLQQCSKGKVNQTFGVVLEIKTHVLPSEDIKRYIFDCMTIR